MPLTMIFLFSEKLYRPVIVCDHCRQAIEDVHDGNYEWEVDNRGQLVDGHIYFTHKQCCLPFEESRGGRTHWLTGGLVEFPIYLGNNLNLDWDKARETAAFLASFQ